MCGGRQNISYLVLAVAVTSRGTTGHFDGISVVEFGVGKARIEGAGDDKDTQRRRIRLGPWRLPRKRFEIKREGASGKTRNPVRQGRIRTRIAVKRNESGKLER